MDTKRKYIISEYPIRVNGTISEVLKLYNNLKIPRIVMLEDYYRVLRYRDSLTKAVNPWEYFHKNINKDKVERGMFASETAFELAAMKLMKQKPTNLISAAFFTHRNEFGFECDYLLKTYEKLLNMGEDALIVNPSPEMIVQFEDSRKGSVGKNYYMVNDETIARLYKMQFPDAVFGVISKIEDNRKMFDSILIVHRDYKDVGHLVQWISCCKMNVIAELPNSFFDNPDYAAYDHLKDLSFGINRIEIIDTKILTVSPRKKSVAYMEKEKKGNSFILCNSKYIQEEKSLVFDEGEFEVEQDVLFKNKMSLIQIWNRCIKGEIENKKNVYSEAKEFVFSNEIHLFYSVYFENEKLVGRAWYRGLENAEGHRYGKRVSSMIEKGLRVSSEEELMSALEKIPFDERVYPFIRSDLYNHYVSKGRVLSLKSIWVYLKDQLLREVKYDGEILFETLSARNSNVGTFLCGLNSDKKLIELLVSSKEFDENNIPYSYLEQLYNLFEIAKRENLIMHNPLDGKIVNEKNRASKRQQDIRQVLVKKHFSDMEEDKIFSFLIEKEKDENTGKYLPRCVKNSIWLLGAIRLFSGISLREACALNWADFREIEDTGLYYVEITKFMKSDEKAMLHSERNDWKRFRCVPLPQVLCVLLNMRKNYLRDVGVKEENLSFSPIVLAAEDLKSLKKGTKRLSCKVNRAQDYCRKLVKIADIPEQILLLPDVNGEKYTDIYKYNGDIFLSNIRMKLNHECKMTVGEINYIVGVEGNDTLSRHYIDYSNSALQVAMVRKMNRWTAKYMRELMRAKEMGNSRGSVEENQVITLGGDEYECSSGEIIVSASADGRLELSFDSLHGIELEIKRYRG